MTQGLLVAQLKAATGLSSLTWCDLGVIVHHSPDPCFTQASLQRLTGSQQLWPCASSGCCGRCCCRVGVIWCSCRSAGVLCRPGDFVPQAAALLLAAPTRWRDGDNHHIYLPPVHSAGIWSVLGPSMLAPPPAPLHAAPSHSKPTCSANALCCALRHGRPSSCLQHTRSATRCKVPGWLG